MSGCSMISMPAYSGLLSSSRLVLPPGTQTRAPAVDEVLARR